MKPLKPSERLDPLAKKYVWWESEKWAYDHPEVFLANVMNLGNWDDICTVRKLLGDATLKQALANAPPGYYSRRAWNYWHYKFGFEQPPPLPIRNL